MIKLDIKTLEHRQQNEERQAKAFYLLAALTKKFSRGAIHCLIPPLSCHEIIFAPAIWWQHVACSSNLNKIRYDYAIENLGVDACAVATMNHTQHIHYYRLNLRVIFKNSPAAFVLLQSTFAKEDDTALPPCATQAHEVSPGLQMRRKLLQGLLYDN